MSTIPDAPLFFRTQELDRILAIVGQKRPAVIVLTGAPGMGKTGLLDTLRARAAADGWAIGGTTGDHKLTVDPRTTPGRFREQLVATLSEPHQPEHTIATTSSLVQRTRSVDADPVVADLAERSGGGPVLITIDDFRPSPAFSSWFERRFVPGLLTSGLPIAVVMAERLGGADVRASATAVIELGPLPVELVKGSLAELSETLDPPLSENEFSVYAREARSPALLDSLLRALSLAEAPEPVR